ncbi:SLD7 [Candida pseudojiufengensis]|uniref:SLD7 n=1 Tax=Candida pseudojiufengensis TaxID=497109 RepID=UPI002224E7E0|nr:SLD7 [Candida pseudojiufengensis]KAI5964795.1 SLD7 [Candida pseudojiufengensis]
MNYKFSTALYDEGQTIKDVQFWSIKETDDYIDDLSIKLNSTSLEFITHIECTKLPIYLINGHSFQIFTNDEESEFYFKHKILTIPNSNKLLNYGILTKIKDKIDSDQYFVFYFNNDNNSIDCLIVDFSVINKLNELDHNNKIDNNSFITKKKNRTIPNTQVFDKVLKQKQDNNPFLLSNQNDIQQNSTSSLSILTNQEQINNAINKLIFSGLRIRGLSKNQTNSINEILKIKEIHQMTYKSAIFALKKYNYTNSNNKKNNLQIKFNDVQEIIENLLHLFVDVE